MRKPVSLIEAPDTMAPAADEPSPQPESSPLWPILLALGDIAGRIERRKLEDPEVDEVALMAIARPAARPNAG
jgi:hypothetical protein